MELASKKYLTLQEANRVLPKVRRLLNRIMRINNLISILEEIEVDFEDEYMSLKQDVKLNKEFHRLYYIFYRALDRLLGMGCVVKDLHMGLVDFCSLDAGKEIYLCYRYGEPHIQFWHEVDECYSDRKHISQLKQHAK